MNSARNVLLLLTAALGLAAAPASAQSAPDSKAGWESDGPFVRIQRGEDGSRTEFKREPNNRVLTKRTFSAGGSLEVRTEYRMDEHGNPRSCRIFDGQGNELFKVRYGYDRTTGQLMEEQMFSSQVKNINPADKQEMPVRRFIYSYDANGQRSKPIAIVLIAGKYAEDLYGAPSALTVNPFEKEMKKTANPAARPLRGGGR